MASLIQLILGLNVIYAIKQLPLKNMRLRFVFKIVKTCRASVEISYIYVLSRVTNKLYSHAASDKTVELNVSKKVHYFILSAGDLHIS